MQHFKQRALALAVSLTVAAGIAGLWRLFTPAPAAVAVGSWGLSFPTEGECPVGNATPEALAEFDAAFVGDPAEPVIYLTFDAGYDNGNTGKILDVLQDRGVPAAFFVTGSFVERNPELLLRMTQEGHIVGNHTYHHYDMAKIADEAAFTAELRDLEDAFQAATGQTLPKYYRPPQGLYSEENLRMAQALGYKTVFWSLAYVDWQQDNQPTSETAFAKLIPRIHNGAVVLLHSTSATNAAILGELLDRWEDMGYRFGTLDELFAR